MKPALQTPALFYSPRRNKGKEPRAALVIATTDQPDTVHLAVFSHPDYDAQKQPVETERHVKWLEGVPEKDWPEYAFAVPAVVAELEAQIAQIRRQMVDGLTPRLVEVEEALQDANPGWRGPEPSKVAASPQAP